MSNQKVTKNTISVLVNDEPGALARVIGLFTGRGYNIDSLTVAPVNLEKKHSRIIIATSGSQMIIEQIISSLERLIQVHKVVDLSSKNSTDEKELAIVKVSFKKDKQSNIKNIAKKFKAKQMCCSGLGSETNFYINFFDEEYSVSWHPAGKRPGKPQTILAGIRASF